MSATLPWWMTGCVSTQKQSKRNELPRMPTIKGVRVTFMGYLENTRIPMQIDIGFGDVITPAPVEAVFPTLLDFPAPKLLAYPKESVIAEKFEAMVKLGIANSRMKDFYDL